MIQTIDRVAELMLTLAEFSDFLDVENAAIKAADAGTIARLAERKQFLSMHYQRQMRMLADRRLEVAELDAGVRTALGDAWAGFNQKMTENVQALKVAQDSTRHVVALIVDAVRAAQSGAINDKYASAYKHSGVGTNGADMACVSVTYNKIL
jgi:hypothetical protein